MEADNFVLGFLSDDRLDNLLKWVEAAPHRFFASPAVVNQSYDRAAVAGTTAVASISTFASAKTRAVTPTSAITG